MTISPSMWRRLRRCDSRGWRGFERNGVRVRLLPALLAMFFATSAAAGPLADVLDAPPSMPFAEEFDCVNAFDLFASFAALQCATSKEAPHDRFAIARALARLQQLQLMAAPADLQIRFCPLLNGTGLVPAPKRVLLDDGLRAMSTDGLAEIIAHELVHVQQFEQLGSAEFKCAYVRAMSACGGCQDRAHPLEDAAYQAQDHARAALLNSAQPPVAAELPQDSAK